MPDMSRNFRLALLTSLPIAAVLLGAQATPADLVLTNGIVITVDPRDSVAEAVAVRGGKIVFVGTSARAKAYVGEKTQVIDLTAARRRRA
jgi:adenine deaminase